MKQKKCTDCGEELLKGQNFCPKCGNNINESMDKLLTKMEKDCKRAKLIKYSKNGVKGICIASVPFFEYFSLEFMLENVLLNKNDEVVKVVLENKDLEVNSTEEIQVEPKQVKKIQTESKHKGDIGSIKTPFKPSDIKVEKVKVEKNYYRGRARIMRILSL